MMTETPPGSWPAADDDRAGLPTEDEASRPSTMETYTTSEETKPVIIGNDSIPQKDSAKAGSDKQWVLKMLELPPEILET